MATNAIQDGFSETLWIDSDIAFNPDDVEKLRAHDCPIVSGIYSKKGVEGFASVWTNGSKKVSFGDEGGLVELKFAATGFLLVRREVYCRLERKLGLPLCNQLFQGRPTIPFFLPRPISNEDDYWYLGEDFAFSSRAAECGYKILADTTIRLWHIGTYKYGWEDATSHRERFDSFDVTFRDE